MSITSKKARPRTRKSAPPKPLRQLRNLVEPFLPSAFAGDSELVAALKRDHDDLRSLIEVLKSDKAIATRRVAYRKFVALLTSHARAEEKAVYERSIGHAEVRKKTLEGTVEHLVGDDLVARIARIRDPEKWSAAVQVLAEVTEHHLKEEERDLFPELDRLFALEQRLEAEAEFLELRVATQAPAKDAGVVTELAG